MKTIQKANTILIISILILFIYTVQLNAQEYGQWEILNEGGWFRIIDFVNNQVGWITGDGKLLKTNDGVDTWITVTMDPNWHIDKVDFINENVGWATGETGLILRYDGVSWIDQNTGKIYPYKFSLS